MLLKPAKEIFGKEKISFLKQDKLIFIRLTTPSELYFLYS